VDTSPFNVGQGAGRDWMLRILATHEAARAKALLAQRLVKFRAEGKELRGWETGFVCGAEGALRDSE
jgi:hypothetical protein